MSRGLKPPICGGSGLSALKPGPISQAKAATTLTSKGRTTLTSKGSNDSHK
jgi:hypothetical protein